MTRNAALVPVVSVGAPVYVAVTVIAFDAVLSVKPVKVATPPTGMAVQPAVQEPTDGAAVTDPTKVVAVAASESFAVAVNVLKATSFVCVAGVFRVKLAGPTTYAPESPSGVSMPEV